MARRPSQHDYNRMHRAGNRKWSALLLLFVHLKIDAEEFHRRSFDMLVDLHTRAAVLGRKRGGDLSDRDAHDEEFGRDVAETQVQFLTKFAEDIAADRYRDEHGVQDEEAVLRRGAMYTDRLRGTANDAFAGTGEGGEMYEWLLGGTENHCQSCPELAADSPYRLDDLPTFPGSGGTECLTNCLCFLQRVSDGVVGFKRAA